MKPAMNDGIDFSEYGPAIAVDGGIHAKSKRGAIGSQWWSRRFIDAMESLGNGGRLTRGRSYARKGQVIGYSLGPGIVHADVQGSRPRPYQVTIKLAVFTDAQWEKVIDALAAQAIYRATLLAGELPTELEELLTGLGMALFPRAWGDLQMSCTCPDWGMPCKHIAAVFYLLAEEFDDDPFAVLAWRGRDRDQLLDGVRARSGAVAAQPGPAGDVVAKVADEPLTARLGDFYSPGPALGRHQALQLGPVEVPGLLLKTAEPPQLTIRRRPLAELLDGLYAHLSRDLGEGAEDEAE